MLSRYQEGLDVSIMPKREMSRMPLKNPDLKHGSSCYIPRHALKLIVGIPIWGTGVLASRTLSKGGTRYTVGECGGSHTRGSHYIHKSAQTTL